MIEDGIELLIQSGLSTGVSSGTVYNVSGATWAAGAATLAIGAHGIVVGQSVTVSGVSPSGYNGTAVVSAVDATHISYPIATNPGAYSDTGTATAGASPLMAPGGFAAILPRDYVSGGSMSVPMAWTYRSILSEPTHVLEGEDPFTTWEVQIDCHGQTAALAQSLARAIRAVLRSFPCPGSLPDSDQMFVMNIHALPQQLDGFNEESRTYVRTLEYQVQYLNIE